MKTVGVGSRSSSRRRYAMLSLAIGRLLAVSMLLLSVSVARAQVTDESDLTEEVVLRCLHDMGEFGIDAVRACNEQDRTAARALAQYPPEARQIVGRCTRQMQRRGWSMVRACADRDIEAAAVLAEYATKHKVLVERCEAQLSTLGAAMVKACVDQDLEAQRPRDPRAD